MEEVPDIDTKLLPYRAIKTELAADTFDFRWRRIVAGYDGSRIAGREMSMASAIRSTISP